MRTRRILSLRRRRDDERGVVSIIVATMLSVLVIMAAFAVDLGMQRVSARDVQALADAEAIDLSRLLDGRTTDTIVNGPVATGVQTFSGAAAASQARNQGTVFGTRSTLTVTPYLATVDQTSSGCVGQPITLTSSCVTLDTRSDMTALLPNAVPNVVIVQASVKMNYAFAETFGVTQGSATRTSVGMARQSACFDLGSYAAAINSGDSSLLSPLNSLLGLNLSAISYQGLAGADVSLSQLAADAHLGDVNSLLTGNVSVANFTAAAIDVLQKQSPPNSAAIAALQAIQASSGGAQINLGQALNISPTDTSALNVNLNLLNLLAGGIQGGVQVANGTNAVAVNNLQALGASLNLYVTQGKQTSCDFPNDPNTQRWAHASQISANATIPLTIPAPVAGLTVTGAAILSGGLGNAVGHVVAPPVPACNGGTTANPDTFSVAVNNGLLGLGLTTNLTINGTISTGLGGLLDSVLGALISIQFNNVQISLGSAAPGTSTTAQTVGLKVPQNQDNATPMGTPVKTGSAYGGLGTLSPITTSTAITGTITVKGLLGSTTVDLSKGGAIGTVLGNVISGLNSTLNTLVNSALVPAVNAALTPLAKLLGVNAGGADVYSQSPVTCFNPNLVD